MLQHALRIMLSQPKRMTAQSAVVAVCTLVGDLLEPLAEFTTWFLVGFLVVLVGSLLRLSRWQRMAQASGAKLDPEQDQRLEGVRVLLPLSFLGAVFSTGLLAWQQLYDAGDKGVLATQVEPIADLQRQLGITRADIEDIKEGIGRIEAAASGGKRETSEDPRKELANIGVQWGTQAFVDALMTGDTRVIELFFAGGMKADALHNGSSAILYAIQRYTADPVSAVRSAIAAGFDVNTRLVDTRTILPRNAINHFEGPNVPEGYAAWQGTFAGPMLLWVACRATWIGADETDWQLVDLLLENGADVSAALDYLEFQENGVGALDGTGTYNRLRRMLSERRGDR